MDALLKVVKAFVEGAVDELFEQIDSVKDDWSKATDEVPEKEESIPLHAFRDLERNVEQSARLIRKEAPNTAAEIVRLAKMDADDDQAQAPEAPGYGPRRFYEPTTPVPGPEPVIYEAFTDPFEGEPNAFDTRLTYAEIINAIPGATTVDQVEDLLKWTLLLEDTTQRKTAGVALLQQASRMLYSPDYTFSDDEKSHLVIVKVEIGMRIFGLEGNRTKGPDTPTTDF